MNRVTFHRICLRHSGESEYFLIVQSGNPAVTVPRNHRFQDGLSARSDAWIESLSVPAARANAGAVSSFRSDSANLDLIRAFAVLSVFFGHLHDILTGRHTLLGWHFAQIGVLTFFVHTSLVLMLSLDRTKVRGKALFGTFYLRRFFRLYPLSMVCVTVAMLLSRTPDMGHPIRHWHFSEYLSNLTLTTNLTYTDVMVGALWTLPLEVQMYLALPFLWLACRARNIKTLLIIWAFSVPLAITQLHTTGRLNVLGYAPCFMGGIIAWKLSLSVRRRFAGSIWPFAFMLTWPLFFIAGHGNDIYYRWGFCFGLGLAIPWFKEISFHPVQVTVRFVAKYSYGVYLSHCAVMMWTFALPIPIQLRWLIFVPLAVGTPVAMFHLIEEPLIKVGQRVSNKIIHGLEFPTKREGRLLRVRWHVQALPYGRASLSD